jgi:hypothetical protein
MTVNLNEITVVLWFYLMLWIYLRITFVKIILRFSQNHRQSKHMYIHNPWTDDNNRRFMLIYNKMIEESNSNHHDYPICDQLCLSVDSFRHKKILLEYWCKIGESGCPWWIRILFSTVLIERVLWFQRKKLQLFASI